MDYKSLYYQRRRPAADLLRDEIGRESPELASDYLGKTIESMVSTRMPAFQGALQDAREGAIRRGVTGGDLGTSYEGDIISAFDRNTKNEIGGRALDTFENSRGRYLDLLTGQRDYDLAKENAKRKRGGFLGGLVGTLGGAVLGPVGAAAGTQIGKKLFH